MTGQWLGTAGKKTKPQFVPIFVGAVEPLENDWGLEETETGRPKIVSNADNTPGVIGLLSGYSGLGHEIGRVYVDNNDLDYVTVIAHGIGGNDDMAVRFHEYLVRVESQARFLVMGTRKPYYYLTLTPESEMITPSLILPDFEKDFTALDDQEVMTWRRAHGRE